MTTPLNSLPPKTPAWCKNQEHISFHIRALRHIRNCYRMTLQRQSPAPWLLGSSTTVMQYCTVHRLRTLTSYSVCRTRWPELSPTHADVITSLRYSPTDLYWLPVRYRIEYKIALITFKALTTQQPQYLSELIRHYETPRQLRSRGVNILQTSATALNFSKRAFCNASPTVWNSVCHF